MKLCKELESIINLFYLLIVRVLNFEMCKHGFFVTTDTSDPGKFHSIFFKSPRLYCIIFQVNSLFNETIIDFKIFSVKESFSFLLYILFNI